MMNRLLKRLFSADAFGLLLIVMALQTLTYGISSSVRGTDTPRLFIVCLVAALLAYGMSRSGFSGTEASVVAGVVGVLGIWIVTARLAIPLLDLFRSILGLFPQIIPAIQDKIPLDIRHVMESWRVILQASLALAARWQSWWTTTSRRWSESGRRWTRY